MGLGDFFGGGSQTTDQNSTTKLNQTTDQTQSQQAQANASSLGTQDQRSGFDFSNPNASASLNFLQQGAQNRGQEGINTANQFFTNQVNQTPGQGNPFIQQLIEGNRTQFEGDLNNRMAQLQSMMQGQGAASNQNVMGNMIAQALNQRTQSENQLQSGQFNQDVANQQSAANSLVGVGGMDQNVMAQLLPMLAERFQSGQTTGQQQQESSSSSVMQQIIDSLSNTSGSSTTSSQASPFDQLKGVGSVMSMFCWVAREVYGEDNPQWLVFREWMMWEAPKWFFNLYLTFGERFAKFIKGKPRVKKLIKYFMDKVTVGRDPVIITE